MLFLCFNLSSLSFLSSFYYTDGYIYIFWDMNCILLLLLLLSHFSRVRLCMIPQTAATSLPCPWDSPGKNTGVGCHFLLQRIFPTQASNPALSHCRQMLYHLSHQGSPEPTRKPLHLSFFFHHPSPPRRFHSPQVKLSSKL